MPQISYSFNVYTKKVLSFQKPSQKLLNHLIPNDMSHMNYRMVFHLIKNNDE